ncbi:MAG: thermonuclease family protein [Candidatus Thiodiazotropha sp.]
MLLNFKVSMISFVLLVVSSRTWCIELVIQADSIVVEDGDTLVISFADGKKRVQLMDIDAPEDTENAKFKVDMRRTGLDHDSLYSLGAIATQHLAKLIAGEESFTLRYQPGKRDRYGRLIGKLMANDGISLSERMVLNGYAIVTASVAENPSHPYVALQRNAQDEMRGLWGLLPKQTHLWAGTSFKP